MFYTCLGILIRIFSNSYLNVFQKILTNKGQKSSVVNFYTYLGLCLTCIWFLKDISTDELKSKFKPGKFSEVCVNHLLAMAKSCNCIDKKEIIANLKNIRKEAH